MQNLQGSNKHYRKKSKKMMTLILSF